MRGTPVGFRERRSGGRCYGWWWGSCNLPCSFGRFNLSIRPSVSHSHSYGHSFLSY